MAVDFSAVKEVFVPYRRVSTREQADSGAGLAAQRTALTHWFGYKQLTALTWDCVDRGKSGKNMERDGLDQALALIRSGQASGLVVSKLDRLSRSLVDFAALMTMAEKEGWNIICLDVGLDLATPIGKFVAGILALFAEFERDVIRQRTRDGLAEKKAAGVVLGRRRSINDDLLGAIVGEYLIDGSFSSVARWLNENEVPLPHGGLQWHPGSVRAIVTSQYGQAFLQRMEAA